MSEVVMPRLSDSMEEGTILTWLKQVGDEVAVGDELVEIETDKANMAYESDTAGTLQEILAQEGETLPIGSPIARIGDSNGQPESDEGPTARPAGPVDAGDPPPPARQEGVPPTTPPTALAARAAVLAAFVALLVHTLAYAGFFEDPITWVLLAVGASLAHAAAGDDPVIRKPA